LGNVDPGAEAVAIWVEAAIQAIVEMLGQGLPHVESDG